MNRAWVKGLFLGSIFRIVGTIILALIVVIGAGFAVGFFGVPSVAAVENEFGGVNDTTTIIETDVIVNNPNPIGLKLGGSSLDYSIAMNDVPMAEGNYGPLGVSSGNSTLNFTSYMDNTQIPDWWVSHVGNGEYTVVDVDATVHSSLLPLSVAAPEIQEEVNTDITAAFNSTETQPIEADQPLVSDPVLYLNETSGHWGAVSATETEVVMDFVVYNPKSYPVGASEIGYDISMNDVDVGEGATDSSVTIPPGETQEITATTTIRNERLDDWWVTHLERNQRTNLTIDFYARFDFSNVGGGTIEVPLDTMHSHFETDIFGTKNQSSAGNGGSGDSGDSGETGTMTPADDSESTGTPSENDGTATDTPADDGGEATGTPTPTPTPTETDDGGLLG